MASLSGSKAIQQLTAMLRNPLATEMDRGVRLDALGDAELETFRKDLFGRINARPIAPAAFGPDA